jgi:hypothetical protein
MSLDDTDETRKKKIDLTFRRILTEDDVRKQAEALGFTLDLDRDTEIASLWRPVRDEKEDWAIYTGHWTSISSWLHGYAIGVLYLGHL